MRTCARMGTSLPVVGRFATQCRAIFENGLSGILMSHRFSTIGMAGHIAVLGGGGIMEQGSHDDLISSGSRYAELRKCNPLHIVNNGGVAWELI